jgi:signal transduction histidine kinase
MNPPCQTILENIDIVFFFYGLSFFCMGLAIFLETGRSSESEFSKALQPLSVFGIVHGSHEWFEMFIFTHPQICGDPGNVWISVLRVVLLAISFIFLTHFGAGLVIGPHRKRMHRITLGAIAGLWLLGLLMVYLRLPDESSKIIAADVYTRYSLAIPGAVLTAWGLLMQRQKFLEAGLTRYGNDVAIAAFSFLIYGVVGQLFASPSAIFPSSFLNAELFIRWFGFPVQIIRAMSAALAAFFIIRSLRAFEEENKHRIEMLREAQLEERRQLEATRAELLHRTVIAQESERKRIARELHDETGQTFTGLGLGLRSLAETIRTDPQRAIQQTRQLEGLTSQGIEELQRLVGGLHPPQLDDLGLVAALRWYCSEVCQHSHMRTSLTSHGNDQNIPSDVRVVLFRIVQEAITNILRHAEATQASVEINTAEGSIYIKIEDNGRGFSVDETLQNSTKPHWGLLGMLERAALIQAECNILSQPGKGTVIIVEWLRSEHNGNNKQD